MTKTLRVCVVPAMIACAMVGLAAQSADPVKRFEAASLKANLSGSTNLSFDIQPGGRLVAVNSPLRTILGNAYRVQPFQVVGAPAWWTVDRFDLLATAPGASRGDVILMLQTLLAERFKLVVHHDTREMPIYALVLDRSDGALGPQLSRSSLECFVPATADAPGASAPGCGTNMSSSTLTAGGTTLGLLAGNLSGVAGRTIVDRTGLSGAFDVKLTFAPSSAAATSDLPNLFTALREQLGLKLQATTGQMDVLIIDHVEKPDEN